MPKCFEIYGYIVFFWSNENDPLEPVHVHVGKRIGPNTSKIWILRDGSAQVDSNTSRIPARDLRRICKVIEVYADWIVEKWETYFDENARYIDD